jgi:hypothetical protein
MKSLIFGLDCPPINKVFEHMSVMTKPENLINVLHNKDIFINPNTRMQLINVSCICLEILNFPESRF